MVPTFARDSLIWGPVVAATILAFFVLLALGINLVFKLTINYRQKHGSDGLDTIVMRSLNGPISLFFIILGAYLGFKAISQSTHPAFSHLQNWNEGVSLAWLVIVILEVCYVSSHVLQAAARWYFHNVASRTVSQTDDKIAAIINQIIPAIVYPLGVLVAMDTLGIAINPLLAGLGIGGLAVALALSPTIASYIAGTYIVSEGRVREGDYIELEEGPAGFVINVGWRSTTLRNRFNNVVIIPNNKLAESIITNYSAPTPVLTATVECGVSYESDLEEVERHSLEVAQQVINEAPEGYKEFAPRVRFGSFGDSNINFRIVFQATDRVASLEMQSLIIKRLHARFKQEEIEINYPVRKLIFPSADTTDESTKRLEAGQEGRP